MKPYWYIKHKNFGAIRVIGSGYTCGKWDGFLYGIHDITRFPEKKYALSALTALRFMKSEKEKKKFKLVKVNVKSK